MAEREITKSGTAATTRQSTPRYQAKSCDEAPTRRSSRHRIAHASEVRVREPDYPSLIFMNGGWGTIHDAALYLGRVSTGTVRREIRRGRLQAYKVGGRKLLRLKREHCDRWLESQAVSVPVKL